MIVLLKNLSLALTGAGIFFAVWPLFAVRSVEPPTTGPRGAARLRARREHPWFRRIEPLVLLFAAWSRALPLAGVRTALDERLRVAGHWLGLDADEFLGLSAFGTLTGLALSTLVSTAADGAMGLLFVVGPIAGIYPYARLATIVDDRHIAISHGLPPSIDLLALAMTAGLDFPAAVREVVEKAADPNDPLVEEYRRMLNDLELGRTRREALSGFAERVPIEPVKDFVGTVIQAEEKGNPLVSVLTIQAKVMRERRSVQAEESAAKAAILLMGPLGLVLVVFLFVVAGPMVIELMGIDGL